MSAPTLNRATTSLAAALDMKSGDAVLIELLEELAGQVSELEGNILFGAVCDEECNSRGMLRFVPELERLQREERGSTSLPCWIPTA